MIKSLDNYKLRAALLSRGFQDITSADRATKSWKLRHPQMDHWISIKLAADVSQPMAKAPLVVHPDDLRRLSGVAQTSAGMVFEHEPFKGASTKYEGGVLGQDLSLADESAVDAFVAAVLDLPSAPQPIDPMILVAATADIDTGLRGRIVTETTRKALIDARVGQGRFREGLMRIWHRRCAVTGCGVEQVLVASHAVPWRENKEPETCLDPYNGLLLTASIDKLFDQHLISFDQEGRLLCKSNLSVSDLQSLGLAADARLRTLAPQHLPYLAAHRTAAGF